MEFKVKEVEAVTEEKSSQQEIEARTINQMHEESFTYVGESSVEQIMTVQSLSDSTNTTD